MKNTEINHSLQPLSFDFLTTGSIKPSGWLKKQLQIQAEGLTGHLDEFWPDLVDNKWLGGERDGWERGPYYVDGLLPLAYLLDDKRLKQKALNWIEAFLNYQEDEGWIGPVKPAQDHHEYENDHYSYDPWPIFVVLKVLTQYYEISEDKRVIEVMVNFFRYIKNNLENKTLDSWAKYRWGELILSLQWLYEQTDEEWLINVAEKISEQGYDWQKHFKDFRYKEKRLKLKMETHVVNNAMGIKTPGIWYRQSGNKDDKKAVYEAINKLDKFHGQVTGVFTGDEHLSGKNPIQGTELCAVVEYMFSLENLISIFGEPAFADRLEKIAFNALPATFKSDMCAHQYDQQANQVICNIAKRSWTNGPDANIFGLEPNFGCCTANMHQGWPKFVNSLWMKSGKDGLVATAYSPCKLFTTINGGRKVKIIEETEYPFNNQVKFKIDVEEEVEFSLFLRIPGWAKDAKVILPDGEHEEITQSGSFYKIKRTWFPGDTVKLILPMDLRTERHYSGSVTIHRGPLVFSLKMGEEWKLIDGELPWGDWEVYPTTPWNYGLKIDTNNPAESIDINYKSLKEKNPFVKGNSPLELKVEGRQIKGWRLDNNSAGEIPQSPIRSEEEVEPLTLIPYGCTNLRITNFPLLVDD